jgi:hypothetical protein
VRIEGWESRLAAYIESAGPFAWGERDCALWCAGWVKECTGQDFLADWQRQYSTEEEARALMVRRGFRDAQAVADAHLQERPLKLAQRGDIVLHPCGALGICNGRFSHFLGESGPFKENTLDCRRAWQVG